MNDPKCVHVERVVKLEVKVEHLEQHLEKLLSRLDTLTHGLEQNNDLLTRYKGMVAGAALLVSIIWVGGLALWSILSDLHL